MTTRFAGLEPCTLIASAAVKICACVCVGLQRITACVVLHKVLLTLPDEPFFFTSHALLIKKTAIKSTQNTERVEHSAICATFGSSLLVLHIKNCQVFSAKEKHFILLLMLVSATFCFPKMCLRSIDPPDD